MPSQTVQNTLCKGDKENTSDVNITPYHEASHGRSALNTSFDICHKNKKDMQCVMYWVQWRVWCNVQFIMCRVCNMHVRRGHAVCIALCTMETMQYMHNQKYAVHNVKCVGYAICTMCKMCAMCRAQGACRVISWLSRGRRCHTNHNAHSAQKFGSRNVRFLYFYTIVVFISMILRDQDIRSGCQIIYASFFGQDGKLTCNIII